jgi:hypothetical protein
MNSCRPDSQDDLPQFGWHPIPPAGMPSEALAIGRPRPDLLSVAPSESLPPPPSIKRVSLMAKPTDEAAAAYSPRHVLPKDLPNTLKHLRDEELDRLLAAALAEAKRRGRRSSPTDKPSPKRKVDAVAVSLTRGQLNAVRAAFKAGITPSRIARQFGLSRSDVRNALAIDQPSRGTID